MHLKDALPLIRTGDVLLFRGRSVFAWLVKLRTRSVYSHAGIAIRIKADGLERVSVLEALEPRGVQLYPLDEYVQAGEVIDWFCLTGRGHDREAVARFALAQWGRRYGMRNLWWSFSRVAWCLKHVLRRRPVADTDRWFCSQLVAESLRRAGFETGEDMVSIETDPGAVARFSCLQRRGTLQPDEPPTGGPTVNFLKDLFLNRKTWAPILGLAAYGVYLLCNEDYLGALTSIGGAATMARNKLGESPAAPAPQSPPAPPPPPAVAA